MQPAEFVDDLKWGICNKLADQCRASSPKGALWGAVSVSYSSDEVALTTSGLGEEWEKGVTLDSSVGSSLGCMRTNFDRKAIAPRTSPNRHRVLGHPKNNVSVRHPTQQTLEAARNFECPACEAAKYLRPASSQKHCYVELVRDRKTESPTLFANGRAMILQLIASVVLC